MQQHEPRMSPACLRALLIVQWLTVALAIHFGQMSLDWQSAPDADFKGSPDAFYNMMEVVSTWWILKGACIAVALNMVVLALWRRREIAAANWLVKLYWLGFVLPIPVVVWFGRNITT